MASSPSMSVGGALAPKKFKLTRRSAEKSRQGCSRCKARRVKCDQRYPACDNCTKYGTRCPGFQQQLRWSGKHERHGTTPFDETLGCNDSSGSEAVGTGLPCPPSLAPDRQETDHLAPGKLFNSSRSIRAPIAREPTHVPSLLIAHWFRNVCPRRSAFDSQVNYNRRLASGTWASSQSVYLALQAMSAACLAGTMPQIQDILPSLTRDAVAVIQKETIQIRSAHVPEVTVDLVFATFVLGTSIHWMDTAVPEHEWLESARELLPLWKTDVSPMYPMLQAHFRQALTYWEMCATAAGHDFTTPRLDRRLQRYRDQVRSNLFLLDRDHECRRLESLPDASSLTLWSSRPNSYCGVSNEVVDYFGQVLALCRRARSCVRHLSVMSVPITTEAFCDLSVAYELQRDLLSLDFSSIMLVEEAQGFSVETEDARTPVHHLLETAEAYRLAALLHLYMMFGNLVPFPGQSCDWLVTPLLWDPEVHCLDPIVREQVLLETALQLIAILRNIPAESGSSSIHPILYLSAAAALKLRTMYDPLMASCTEAATTPEMAPRQDKEMECSVSNASLLNFEVVKARGFVLDRLNLLQQMLPHRTSHRMLQFVNTLWDKYDSPQPGAGNIYWADVVSESGWNVVVLR